MRLTRKEMFVWVLALFGLLSFFFASLLLPPSPRRQMTSAIFHPIAQSLGIVDATLVLYVLAFLFISILIIALIPKLMPNFFRKNEVEEIKSYLFSSYSISEKEAAPLMNQVKLFPKESIVLPFEICPLELNPSTIIPAYVFVTNKRIFIKQDARSLFPKSIFLAYSKDTTDQKSNTFKLNSIIFGTNPDLGPYFTIVSNSQTRIETKTIFHNDAKKIVGLFST